MAFLEDDLTYSFNKVQEGKDVQGVAVTLLAGSRGCGRRSLSELSKSLRGSGLGYYQGVSVC
jgi:hypothetical protein